MKEVIMRFVFAALLALICFAHHADSADFHGSCYDRIGRICVDFIGSRYSDFKARKEYCDDMHSGPGELRTGSCKKRDPGCRIDKKTDTEQVMYVSPEVQPFFPEICKKDLGGEMDPKTPVKHVTRIRNLSGHLSNFSPIPSKDLKIQVSYSRCTKTSGSYCVREEWEKKSVALNEKNEFLFDSVGWDGFTGVYKWKIDAVPQLGEKAYYYQIPDIQTEDEMRAHSARISLFYSPQIILKFVDQNGRLFTDQEIKDRRIRVSYKCSNAAFTFEECNLFFLLTILVQRNAVVYVGRPLTWSGDPNLVMEATASYFFANNVKKVARATKALTTEQFPTEVLFVLD
jgi:hypothetical protein